MPLLIRPFYSHACFLVLALHLRACQAWVPHHPVGGATTRNNHHRCRATTTTQLDAALLPAAAASLLAGSVAGALGVGVAYPLDTIKTKQQVLAAAATNHSSSIDYYYCSPQTQPQQGTLAPATMTLMPTSPILSSSSSSTTTVMIPTIIPVPGAHATLTQVATYIYQTGGLSAFFAGVSSSMMGQAIIKAVVFATNAAVLEHVTTHHYWFGPIIDQQQQLPPGPAQYLCAAAMAGFVTSFLAAPVDRIKVLMQCRQQQGRRQQGEIGNEKDNDTCCYLTEGDCIQAVLNQEGWQGFLTRGLGCTMLREIPAYSLYFGVYGGLNAACGDLTALLGPTLAAALYGATAGCACWLPIYPIDVIRTLALNTNGNNNDGNDNSNNNNNNDDAKSAWELAVKMYQQQGFGAFYDGLGARLLRQAVNHAVTFSVYEVLMQIARYDPTATQGLTG